MTYELRGNRDGRSESTPGKGRLQVILARESPRAVIFRRGPTRHVLLIAWNTETDELSIGQWLNGRVYERRSDLSPSGDLLLYFAGSHRPPHFTWTAVSRPPFFTALAFWPQRDTYGGGGLFESDTAVALDRSGEIALAEGFQLPDWFKVGDFAFRQSWAESDSVWFARLTRDGWTVPSLPTAPALMTGGRVDWRFPRKVWERAHPRSRHHHLRMTLPGSDVDERERVHYELLSGELVTPLHGADWADWDRNGHLLFSAAGALYRLRYDGDALASLDQRQEIADFSDLRFEARPPDAAAMVWPKP